jgi:hypothetical protein
MIKIENSKLKIQKLFPLTLLLLFTFYLSLSPASTRAVDSTQSADFKTKLKSLQEEIASKAAQLKQEISQKLQNKAYPGFIKSKSDNSLTVTTKSGTKIVNVNEFTEYTALLANSRQQKFSQKTLEVDDYLVALGDIDDNGVMTAKKIIRLEVLKPLKKEIIFGQVISINSDSKAITLQNKDGQNHSYTCNKDTVYQAGKNAADFSMIKIGRNLIIVGVESPRGGQIARLISVLPGSGEPEKVSTDSAKVASPSAAVKPSSTVKKTPTPTPKKPVN